MTVNPGFYGQRFLSALVPNIAAVREMIERAERPIDLAVDGGVAEDTAERVVRAGARVLIAGAAVFGQADRPRAIAALRARAGLGLNVT
jgi:ribulose-phosphate 3-epimerase